MKPSSASRVGNSLDFKHGNDTPICKVPGACLENQRIPVKFGGKHFTFETWKPRFVAPHSKWSFFHHDLGPMWLMTHGFFQQQSTAYKNWKDFFLWFEGSDFLKIIFWRPMEFYCVSLQRCDSSLHLSGRSISALPAAPSGIIESTGFLEGFIPSIFELLHSESIETLTQIYVGEPLKHLRTSLTLWHLPGFLTCQFPCPNARSESLTTPLWNSFVA